MARPKKWDSMTPEERETWREKERAYSQRPERKARQKARTKTQKYKAYEKARRQIPEYKERQKTYYNIKKQNTSIRLMMEISVIKQLIQSIDKKPI